VPNVPNRTGPRHVNSSRSIAALDAKDTNDLCVTLAKSTALMNVSAGTVLTIVHAPGTCVGATEGNHDKS
jgi:hypothetical protein